MLDIRSINTTRYVTPLREGGSLPAIVEGDDGFLYVLKFRGAGQGIKALVSEFIGSEVARALGLKVPEVVFAFLDEGFGRTEPDEEIQDLLKASTGQNLALHYLSSSVSYDPAVTQIEPMMASIIVWMDALLTNMDRTVRNTNMLMWQKELWLIDHGACLYFHHNWEGREHAVENKFPLIKEHVLLSQATMLDEADRECRVRLTETVINNILATLPDEWLQSYDTSLSADQIREVYSRFINFRVIHSSIFLNEIRHAQATAL